MVREIGGPKQVPSLPKPGQAAGGYRTKNMAIVAEKIGQDLKTASFSKKEISSAPTDSTISKVGASAKKLLAPNFYSKVEKDPTFEHKIKT